MTFAEVPRRTPPRTTRAGTLQVRPGARGGHAPDYPLAGLDPRGPDARPASPLAGLELPRSHGPGDPGPEPVVLLRACDQGRLYVPALVAAAGWAPLSLLVADLSVEDRITLRAFDGEHGPVAGSTRPHVDKDGRIVVTIGLRSYLGLANGEGVLVWTLRDGLVHLAPARCLPAAFAAVDALRGLSSATAAEPTAEESPAAAPPGTVVPLTVLPGGRPPAANGPA